MLSMATVKRVGHQRKGHTTFPIPAEASPTNGMRRPQGLAWGPVTSSVLAGSGHGVPATQRPAGTHSTWHSRRLVNGF